MDNMNPNQMPPMPKIEEHKSSGPLISVVVILILIIIGGLYFLKQRADQKSAIPNIDNMQQTDSVTASLKTQSSSDDLNSINADLKNTNVDSVDQGAAAKVYSRDRSRVGCFSACRCSQESYRKIFQFFGYKRF